MSQKGSPGAVRSGMFIMPFHDPAKPAGPVLRRGPGADRPGRGTGLRRVLDRRASHDEVREHRDARDLHRPRAGRDEDASAWGRPRSASSSTTRPTSPCRLAFLDHLSKGRLNLCFGAGSVTADQELYGVEPKNAAEMVDEAIEMILKLWSSDPPYEIDGKYWKIQPEEDRRRRDGHRLHPQALPAAAPADRHPGHEPQLAEHEDRRPARATSRSATA